MVIGDRLRALREQKGLSQGDIEKRSGLKRAYISRVEHGHIVPSIDNLERIARTLEVALYEVFYEGKGRPKRLHLRKGQKAETVWGRTGKGARVLSKFHRLLARMGEGDRLLLLYMAQKMANRQDSSTKSTRIVTPVLQFPQRMHY